MKQEKFKGTGNRGKDIKVEKEGKRKEKQKHKVEENKRGES